LDRVEKSIEIKAPPEKVWAILALDRLLEWQLGFDKAKSIEYTSEVCTTKDKYRVGASAQRILKKQGESSRLILKSREFRKREDYTSHT